MRYNDKPISRPEQDVFGRAKFASLLASAIDSFSSPKSGVAKDGYVIAINGKWGSGKSSVIELVIRYLRHAEMARASEISLPPTFREPAPKTADELEEMSRHYEEIEERILEIESDNRDTAKWEPLSRLNEFNIWLGSKERANIADEYWRLKIYTRSHPRTLVVRFSPWLFAGQTELAAALLSELARSLGQSLGNEVRAAFGQVLGRLAELAPIAGAGINLASGTVFGSFLSAGSSLIKKSSNSLTLGPTLDELRLKLRSVLRKFKNKQILVVIDDIDRLTPDEALAMVSLVKGLGDLPNLIYVLSYDGDVLSSLLTTALENANAVDYLDKIVQYAVELPVISEDDIFSYFNMSCADVIEKISAGDQKRFGFAWTYFLRYYLETPRDVRRLVNGFSFSFSALHDHVDPVDLLILEAYRLFEPKIYLYIRDNFTTLVD